MLLTASSLLLAGCGFKLRGVGDDHFALQEINLEARDTYGQTQRQLKALLESNHVKINPTAKYTFNILDESTSRRTSSYTSSARVAEYALTSTLTYEFKDRNGLQLLQDSVQTRKLQSYDENNVIGSYQESVLLRDEMRQQLVQMVVERLQRISPEQLDKLAAAVEAQAAETAEQQRRDQQPQQSPVSESAPQ